MNGVTEKTHHHVIIIGTGFAGLGMGIRLHQHEMTDFVLLERAAEVGGTWRDNRYPGCACDVPSQLYSFSFELNPSWSRSFSGQQEIWDYLRHCVDRYGFSSYIRFHHDVLAAAQARGNDRLGTPASSSPDPALRAKLTPDYTIGCKRILISNDYLPSLTKPNVQVVTSARSRGSARTGCRLRTAPAPGWMRSSWNRIPCHRDADRHPDPGPGGPNP